MSGTIQLPGWPARGLFAQALITSAKALSNLISHVGSLLKRSSLFRRDRCSLNSSACSTMRGSGLHHNTGWPRLNQGKIPSEYARTSVATSSAPPAANNPGAGSALPQAASSGGNICPAASHGTGRAGDVRVCLGSGIQAFTLPCHVHFRKTRFTMILIAAYARQ